MYICMYINLDMPSVFTQNIYNHISINILHIYMATKRICTTNTQMPISHTTKHLHITHTYRCTQSSTQLRKQYQESLIFAIIHNPETGKQCLKDNNLILSQNSMQFIFNSENISQKSYFYNLILFFVQISFLFSMRTYQQ